METVKRMICLWLLSVLALAGPAAAEEFTLRTGTLPNLWFAQSSVIREHGLDTAAGLHLELHNYPGLPVEVQSFLAGQIDVLYINVGSLLLIPDVETAVRIVASTIHDDVYLIARQDLLAYKKNTDLVSALRAFAKDKGRRVKIVTNPQGSLSDLVLRHWLTTSFPDYETVVELIHGGDQAQLQQIFISGAADAASAFAPLLVLAQKVDSTVNLLSTPEELQQKQPGGILAVRKTLIDANPEVICKLVEVHIRATEMMQNQPEDVAEAIAKLTMHGLLDAASISTSLKQIKNRLITNPKAMREPAQALAAFMLKTGYLKKPIATDVLFDARCYDAWQAAERAGAPEEHEAK